MLGKVSLCLSNCLGSDIDGRWLRFGKVICLLSQNFIFKHFCPENGVGRGGTQNVFQTPSILICYMNKAVLGDDAGASQKFHIFGWNGEGSFKGTGALLLLLLVLNLLFAQGQRVLQAKVGRFSGRPKCLFLYFQIKLQKESVNGYLFYPSQLEQGYRPKIMLPPSFCPLLSNGSFAFGMHACIIDLFELCRWGLARSTGGCCWIITCSETWAKTRARSKPNRTDTSSCLLLNHTQRPYQPRSCSAPILARTLDALGNRHYLVVFGTQTWSPS